MAASVHDEGSPGETYCRVHRRDTCAVIEPSTASLRTPSRAASALCRGRLVMTARPSNPPELLRPGRRSTFDNPGREKIPKFSRAFLKDCAAWLRVARPSAVDLSLAPARPAPTPHATCTPRRPGRSPPRPPLRPPPKPRARTPPPSFSTSARRLAASPRQTLRMPRQPADRTARATWPACLAVPAPRQPEPATHAPRHTGTPVSTPPLRPQGLPRDVLRGLRVSASRLSETHLLD